MTMTSGQCDELRERATALRQGRWSDGENDATLMEQAADTIWELSCKLAGVVDQCDEIERLKAENAKLRELVDAVKEFVEDTHCEDCPCRRDCDDNNRIFCVNDFSYHAFAAMRDLRIEVDG